MSNQAVDTAVGVGLEVSPEPAGPGAPAVQRHAWLAILRNALRLGRTKIGIGIAFGIERTDIKRDLLRGGSRCPRDEVPVSAARCRSSGHI